MTFEEAYQQYHGRLLGYLRPRTADVDVDDVAQEVWLRVHRHWDSCRHETIWPWLLTIARNVAIDWAKRPKMAPLTECEGAELPPDRGERCYCMCAAEENTKRLA